MSHPLAIITVVYKNYSVLKEFFHSLETQSDKNFKLYIVDLTEKPEQFAKPTFPTTVLTGQNLGYAHGVNLGLLQAVKDSHDRFCVINDDTIVEENFVKNLHTTLAYHPGALIGGKIYYAAGYEYHKSRYITEDLGKVIWYAGGVVDWNNVYTTHRGVDEVDKGQYNTLEDTDFITGCCLSFDKNVYDKVGLWNESYFLYYEDADFCEQAKKQGIPLYYDPTIILWHKNAQSTEGSGSNLHQKYQYHNRLKFGLKYAPLRTKLHLLKNSTFDFFTKNE